MMKRSPRNISQQHRHSQQHSNLLLFMWLIVGGLFFALLIYQTPWRNLWPGFSKEESLTLQVHGQVMDPLTLQGVSGVDLVSGQTTVRTIGSGQFAFGEALRADGLRMTHPQLRRALRFSLVGQEDGRPLNIYFNAEMFSLVTQAIDSEIRGRYDDEYSLLASETQAKVTREKYLAQAKSIFSKENIADQELQVTKISLEDNAVGEISQALFPKSVLITLGANTQTATYRLVFEESGWRLAK